MTTVYPTSEDSFDRPTASSSLSGHAALHDDLADAIEAIENKVGVNNSTDATSIDYKLAHLGDTYYTETEVDNALAAKLNSSAYTANDVLNKIKTVDGAGSGLDADTLDGNQASAFSLAHSHPYAASDHIHGAYLTPNISGTLVSIDSPAGLEIETNVGQTTGLQIYQPTNGDDAAMMFHVNGQYAVLFGLDGYTGELYVGGWSKGANRYKMWHEGNFSPSSYLTTGGKAADSEKLDNLDSTQFLRSDTSDSFTSGTLTFNNGTNITMARSGGNSINISNQASHRGSGASMIRFETGGNDQDIRCGNAYVGDPSSIYGDLEVAGNIKLRGVVIHSSSRTIKNTIEDCVGASDVIDQLRPVTYLLNGLESERGTQIGLIAEEVAEVDPRLVIDAGLPSLNISSLIGLAVAGLKEANTRITELEAKVAELEGR